MLSPIMSNLTECVWLASRRGRGRLGLMGSFLRLVSVCGMTLLAFGCASEKTRYAENPFFASSRFDPNTTGSLTPVRDPAPLFPKAPIGMATNNVVSGNPSQMPSQPSQGAITQQELQPLPSQQIASQPQIHSQSQPQPQSLPQQAPQQSATMQPVKPVLIAPTAKPAPEAKIAAGMIIPVKGGKWAADGGAMVTLGDGETLSTLANRYGVPETALRKINGFSPAAKPIPGTRLLIPVFISDTALYSKGKVQQDQAQMQPVPGIAPSTAKPQPAAAANAVASLGSTPTTAIDATIDAGSPAIAAEQAGVEKTIATTGFRWPARGRIIASFGEANGVKNAGINIALPQGTPVKAAESGVVAYSGNEVKGQGNMVMIRHADGWVSIYANNSELKVKRGDDVKRGQVVALSGQTGDVPSPQLHFELRKGAMPVDPVAHLSED